MPATEIAVTTNATQFAIAVRMMLRHADNRENISADLATMPCVGRAQSLFRSKAAVGGETLDAWQSSDGKVLADAFFGSLANVSLIDAALAAGAKRIPENLHVGLFASGASASTTPEAAPTAVTRLTTDVRSLTATRADALIITSKELAQSENGAATSLIANELRTRVTAASNIALLSMLTSTSATAGTDAIANLKAGLAAADDSRAYVVGATPADTRALALNAEGRMGIFGGEYVPGVHVVAVDDIAHMTVIPVDSLAVVDYGAAVEMAGEADVQMSDSPSGAAASVSLWQTNSVGVLVHRLFAARGTCITVQ